MLNTLLQLLLILCKIDAEAKLWWLHLREHPQRIAAFFDRPCFTTLERESLLTHATKQCRLVDSKDYENLKVFGLKKT